MSSGGRALSGFTFVGAGFFFGKYFFGKAFGYVWLPYPRRVVLEQASFESEQRSSVGGFCSVS